MKTSLISLLTIIAILCMFLCSCNNVVDTNNSNFDTTPGINTSTQIYTTAPFTSYDTSQTYSSNVENPIVPTTDHVIYANLNLTSNSLIETDTRVYILSSMKYYNKLDGETYSLCFDPLCSHIRGTCNPNCPVVAFAGCCFAYCEYTDRIYIIRGDCIFSMNFDASDIKLEYAFSDMGKDLTINNVTGIVTNALLVCDNYLFFLKYTVEKTSTNSIEPPVYKTELYRFDVKTKEIENLSNNNPTYEIEGFLTTKAGQLFGIMHNKDTYERTSFFSDLNFENIIFDDHFCNFSQSYYDGETLISVVLKDYYKDENGRSRYKSNEIASYNLITKEYKILVENKEIKDWNEGSYYLFNSGNGYIFYSCGDPLIIGSYKDKRGGTHYTINSYHTIYSMKIDGSDKKVVFEGCPDMDPTIKSSYVQRLICYSNIVRINFVDMQNNSENPNDWQKSRHAFYLITGDGELEPTNIKIEI